MSASRAKESHLKRGLTGGSPSHIPHWWGSIRAKPKGRSVCGITIVNGGKSMLEKEKNRPVRKRPREEAATRTAKEMKMKGKKKSNGKGRVAKGKDAESSAAGT